MSERGQIDNSYIFTRTPDIFGEIINDQIFLNTHDINPMQVISLQQRFYHTVLRLNRLIQTDTDSDGENVVPEVQYINLFKFILYVCLKNSYRARSEGVRGLSVGNDVDSINRAYNSFLRRLGSRPRPRQSMRRSRSDSTSPPPLSQRRRVGLRINTELANATHENNVNDQMVMENSLRQQTQVSQSSSVINTLSNEIDAMLGGDESMDDLMEHMRLSLDRTIEQNTSSGRPPTPRPIDITPPPAQHRGVGATGAVPSMASIERNLRRQRTPSPILELPSNTPSGQRTETESIVSSATSDTEVLSRRGSPGSPPTLPPLQRSVSPQLSFSPSPPPVADIRTIQRRQRLTFNQLINRITLRNPTHDRELLNGMFDNLYRQMYPDVSTVTPENRLELSSEFNTIIGVIWEDINQRTGFVRSHIESIRNILYDIESSYNSFASIMQNITRQGLRYIPRIGSRDLRSPSIFIRRTYEFFYDLPPMHLSRETYVSIEEQYLTVLMEILNTRPIRIHLNNNKTGHNAANEGILEFKEGQHSGERDKYCDDAFDLITLEPITGDDVIYIEDPEGGKMCYERITFLRILESTVWVTLSLEHFIKSVKIMAKIFYIPEQEFTYSESAKKLDQLFKKIIQKKYENIDNGNNHTTFYPQVFKKVFDMYRLFKDPLNRWMPHEAFLMILENPHIKNFKMVKVPSTGNEFYSVQTMWSGVSAVHEKQLFMLYPMGYNGAKLSYNDLNCNQDRYFHPIVESGGMDTFVVSYFNRYYRANP